MSKSSAINIAVTVDDKGSLTLRKIGDESTKTGDKGEKGFGKMRKGVADLDDSMNLAMPSLTQMGGFAFTTTIAGLGAMAVAGTAMIASAASQAKEIENLSRLANMGSVEFQNYAFATDSVGVSSEKLAGISKDVQDKLGDFIATGGGEFADFFENVAPKIGLTADQLQGLSGPDVLIAVKDAMDQVNLSAEEQIFYLESLGNDASLLTPLLQDNGAALKEQAAQADALGIAISEIESEQLLVAGKNVKQLTGLFGALKNKLAADLSPVFTDLTGKIIDGMAEGAGGVDGLATSLATNLLQGLGIVIEAMRFFHNGWLGIKLVGTGAITLIAHELKYLFDGLRVMMTPLDLLFDALVKFGRIDVNPFDGVEEALGTFAASSLDVTNQVLSDIDKTNASYDKAKGVVNSYVEMVKTSGVEHHKTNTTIVESHNDAQNTISTITLREIAEREKAEKQAADKLLKANEKAATEAAKLASEQAKAYRNMYADMELSAEDNFDYKLGLLEKEKTEYETFLVKNAASHKDAIENQLLIDGWAADQEKKLLDEKLLKTGTFFDGVKLGYEELLRDQITWAEAGKTVFDTFISESTTALSDNPFSIVKGDFDNLGDAWQGMWGSMLKAMTDILADMAIRWAAAKLGDFAVSYFHTGAWEIEEDEIPAILQKGEMVIPRAQSDRIRNGLGGEGHTDVSAFDQLADEARNMDLDLSGFGENLGDILGKDGIRAGAGIASGVPVGRMLDAYAHPTHLVDSIVGAIGKTAQQGTGFDTTAGNYGFTAGSLAAAALGLASPVGVLAALAGAVGFEALADYAGAREFEGFQDAMEDYKGFFGSHWDAGMFGSGHSWEDIVNAGALEELGNALGEIGKGTAESGGDGEPFGGYDGAGGDINNPSADGPKGAGAETDPDTEYARYGGIFDGPMSGYPMEFHGREVVIPLPNGQKVPVDMGALLAEIRNLAASVGAQPSGFQMPAIFLTAYLGGEKIVDKMRVEAENVFIRKSKQRGNGRLQYAPA